MSLLKRLGRTKEEAIKEVENRGTNLSMENSPEQVYGDSTAPRQVKSSTMDASQTYSRLREKKSSEQPQMASAFAARRSAVVQIDQIQELRLAIHRRIVDEMTVAEQQLIAQGKDAREQIKNLIATYLEREMVNNNYNLSRAERMVLVDDICDELLGLGPLEPLLKDNTITEIMVNGPKDIFVERNGKLLLSDTRFYDDNHLMNIIERILAPLGRRVDEASPLVDARLADGSRVNIIIPPLSLIGPTVTIRKFSKNALSVENLVSLGTLSEKMALFLQACVKARLNILVAGGTGSGKTTTLTALINKIKDKVRVGVMEADIDSDVDAIKIAEKTGVKSIQLHTNGMCHLDAGMTKTGLDGIDMSDLDLIFLENVGNLVCPAEFDTGASLDVMIIFPFLFNKLMNILFTKYTEKKLISKISFNFASSISIKLSI